MKRRNVASELVEAMREAAAIAEGKVKPARVTTFKPSIALEIRQIRLATGLSRTEFARRYALDARALQDWEQGRRRPDRAARAYLTVIAHRPKAVEEALAS
ncbi:MAG: helix-turn-helix domain-containing protein [Terracidiphilus sp.]|jgi:putative transcriptional regulator